MSSHWDRFHGKLHIRFTILRLGQEVKNGSVMPEIESANITDGSDIGFDPFHAGRSLTKPLLGSFQSNIGNVENRNFTDPDIEQPVHQKRLASPDIDYATRGR